MSFRYTPDNDIKVHEEGAIKLICKAFQSHENGLPEWLKNSSDAYLRNDIPEQHRKIIVFFQNGHKDIKPSISCLDFVGMTSDAIEDNFRIWADPEAASRGINKSSIQGGHGNGGKCYMTQMFEEYSYIYTVKNQLGNRYGVESGSVKFGYIPNRKTGKNVQVVDYKSELNNVLSPLKFSINNFPQSTTDTINNSSGFTIIHGSGPRGYKGKIQTEHLMESIQEHPQMIRTIELCQIYFVVNGKLVSSEPLSLPKIDPIPGSEENRVINIPEILIDPISGNEVKTVDDMNKEHGIINLKTSNVSMRWKKKGRHNIIFKSRNEYIGFIPIIDLDIQSIYRDQIYGECNCNSLEMYKQNDRGLLVASPLTNAIKMFLSQEIQKYANEFEQKDSRKYNQKEKNALTKMNEVLDKWKNKFLDKYMKGLWGGGDESSVNSRSSLPSGISSKIELTISHSKAGIGVSFRPKLMFYDKIGNRIRQTPYRWISNDTNVAMVDEDLMIINTFSYGKTFINAETLDGKIESNKVLIEVVRINKIDVVPNKIEMVAGSRNKFDAICLLSDGSKTSDIYLVWTESNPNIARVSASGLIYGFSEGETEIIAGDDNCLALSPAKVTVLSGTGKGSGKNKGSGYPRVLISEFQNDPETDEPVKFPSEYPPAYQRPIDADRNIWWINSSSPFAQMYLDVNLGYGFESREWRMYHLERYIDIMVQISLVNGPYSKEEITVNDWILRWGDSVAEIQQNAKSSLFNFISNGELPNV
ncbi:hypothetical protein HQ585_16020 [candidate division KSB1 bacterium]|nr:hypothetical protein [candidate division KSB1 bacterium]